MPFTLPLFVISHTSAGLSCYTVLTRLYFITLSIWNILLSYLVLLINESDLLLKKGFLSEHGVDGTLFTTAILVILLN